MKSFCPPFVAVPALRVRFYGQGRGVLACTIQNITSVIKNYYIYTARLKYLPEQNGHVRTRVVRVTRSSDRRRGINRGRAERVRSSWRPLPAPMIGFFLPFFDVPRGKMNSSCFRVSIVSNTIYVSIWYNSIIGDKRSSRACAGRVCPLPAENSTV